MKMKNRCEEKISVLKLFFIRKRMTKTIDKAECVMQSLVGIGLKLLEYKLKS